MEGIEPSNFVLAKLSYFADLNKFEILFGTRIEYVLEHLTFNQALGYFRSEIVQAYLC